MFALMFQSACEEEDLMAPITFKKKKKKNPFMIIFYAWSWSKVVNIRSFP